MLCTILIGDPSTRRSGSANASPKLTPLAQTLEWPGQDRVDQTSQTDGGPSRRSNWPPPNPRQGIIPTPAEDDALSFDCYGTLIDWEAGIARVLAPWAEEVGLDLTDEELLLAYAENEAQAERDTPEALYRPSSLKHFPHRRQTGQDGQSRAGREARRLSSRLASISRLTRCAGVLGQGLQTDHLVQCAP